MTEFRPSRFEIVPSVTKNLLIINVLCYLAQITIGRHGVINIEDIFALHHVKSPLFEPWQIITHLFLHGNFWHIFFNMFALYMFGAVLESVWGPKRFLTFYFLCGIGAALLQLGWLWYSYQDLLTDFSALKQSASADHILLFLQNYGIRYEAYFDATRGSYYYSQLQSDPGNPATITEALQYSSFLTSSIISGATLGASGAVFGLLAAFVYLFPNNYIYLNLFIPIKAKWFGLGYFVVEIYLGIQNSAGDNVAHWAHVGGGIVGFLLVLTWNKTRRRKLY